MKGAILKKSFPSLLLCVLVVFNLQLKFLKMFNNSRLFLNNNLNVEYTPVYYSECEADEIFAQLQELSFYKPTYKIRGESYQPQRQVCAFGDDNVNYSFSGSQVVGESWTPLMLKLCHDVERTMGCNYNYAVVNLYPNGHSKISHHKDDESCIDKNIPICGLTFGAERTLEFKRPNCEKTSISLQHGSLYAMHKPTNELFTHGIPAEPEVSEPCISVTFRKIIQSEQLPSKKLKINEDDIPNCDWFSKHYQMLCPRESLINLWILEWSTFVTLHSDVKGVWIHMREFTQNAWIEYFATQHGIMMNPPTWGEFSEKISIFCTHYKSMSFVANNQLGVFCDPENCTLQQIFKSSEGGFTFKPTYLKISFDQLLKLSSLILDISQCIQETLLCHALSNCILDIRKDKCKHIQHCDFEEGKQQLIQCVYDDLQQHVNTLFKCNGYVCDHPTMECSEISKIHKYRVVGEKALFSINIKKITDNLYKNYCVCPYNEEFFESLTLSDYKDNFIRLFEM